MRRAHCSAILKGFLGKIFYLDSQAHQLGRAYNSPDKGKATAEGRHPPEFWEVVRKYDNAEDEPGWERGLLAGCEQGSMPRAAGTMLLYPSKLAHQLFRRWC